MTVEDWSDYSEFHTRSQIDALLGLGRFLPALSHSGQHFRGWTILFPGGWVVAWHRYLSVWDDAGILLPPGPGDEGPARCDPAVEAVHQRRDGSWAVEWLDGAVTTGCASGSDEGDD